MWGVGNHFASWFIGLAGRKRRRPLPNVTACVGTPPPVAALWKSGFGTV